MADNRQVAVEADVLLLAVRPQQMAALLDDLHGVVTERHLVVSIAAGVPLAQIAAALAERIDGIIARAMNMGLAAREITRLFAGRLKAFAGRRQRGQKDD